VTDEHRSCQVMTSRYWTDSQTLRKKSKQSSVCWHRVGCQVIRILC